MRDIAVILSVYKNDTLPYLVAALSSLYVQSKEADIFVQIDGIVSLEIKTYLLKEAKNGNIFFLAERMDNRGLAFSLNELLETVLLKEYSYIARMDADDISLPDRMEKQFLYMENNKDIDVVGGYIEEFSEDMAYNKVVHYPASHEEMFRFFAKRVPLAHVSAFFRRSFFEKAGVYPTRSLTNEDTLLWMQGFKNGCRFANIPEVLVKVRVSKLFFSRRSGAKKAWSDFTDRVEVIQTLGYNFTSYGYAFALFLVNIAPGSIKKILYERLR